MTEEKISESIQNLLHDIATALSDQDISKINLVLDQIEGRFRIVLHKPIDRIIDKKDIIVHYNKDTQKLEITKDFPPSTFHYEENYFSPEVMIFIKGVYSESEDNPNVIINDNAHITDILRVLSNDKKILHYYVLDDRITILKRLFDSQDFITLITNANPTRCAAMCAKLVCIYQEAVAINHLCSSKGENTVGEPLKKQLYRSPLSTPISHALLNVASDSYNYLVIAGTLLGLIAGGPVVAAAFWLPYKAIEGVSTGIRCIEGMNSEHREKYEEMSAALNDLLLYNRCSNVSLLRRIAELWYYSPEHHHGITSNSGHHVRRDDMRVFKDIILRVVLALEDTGLKLFLLKNMLDGGTLLGQLINYRRGFVRTLSTSRQDDINDHIAKAITHCIDRELNACTLAPEIIKLLRLYQQKKCIKLLVESIRSYNQIRTSTGRSLLYPNTVTTQDHAGKQQRKIITNLQARIVSENTANDKQAVITEDSFNALIQFFRECAAQAQENHKTTSYLHLFKPSTLHSELNKGIANMERHFPTIANTQKAVAAIISDENKGVGVELNALK